jgi:formate hydrogenlyase subunit 3/multisubunit Na+/H+ antiporter MnhD subunit
MLYLLISLFPISLAASCFALRKQTRLILTLAVLVVLTQTLLVAQVPLDEPTRILGVVFNLTALRRLFLLLFLAVTALSLLAAWHLPHGENFVPVTLLILALTSTILLLQDPFIVSLLLVGSSLAAVLALVDLPPGSGQLLGTRVIASALKYLIMMVLAGVLSYFAFVLADVYQPGVTQRSIQLARLILALLAAGFALRLALIPFHSWLPDAVADAAPMVSVQMLAIINTSSMLVLLLSFERFSLLLVENAAGLNLLRIAGLLTLILAGVLALAQADIRRVLAYLVMYSSGMVFYGLVATTPLGLRGALFEAFNQVLVVALLFVSLGLIERPDGRPPRADGSPRRDLLWRWPIGSVGLLAGGLALLGMPPFNGYASKLLLYQAAAQQSMLELAVLLLATVLAGLALARLAHRHFLGASTDQPLKPLPLLEQASAFDPLPRRLEREPRSTALLVLLLLATCLLIGIYPQPVLALIDEAARGLTFIELL